MREQGPSMRHALFRAAVAALAFALTVSCTHTNSLRTHAYSARAFAPLLDEFASELAVRVEAEERRAAAAAVTRSEGQAALSAVRTRYAPVLGAYEAARQAHAAYVAAVLEAVTNDQTRVAPAFAQRLRIAWTEMIGASIEAGLAPPPMPEGEPP